MDRDNDFISFISARLLYTVSLAAATQERVFESSDGAFNDA